MKEVEYIVYEKSLEYSPNFEFEVVSGKKWKSIGHIVLELFCGCLVLSQHLVLFLVAPIKALCSQRFDDWKEKFGPIGLICKELTGDTAVDDLFEIQHAHIILTTPVSFKN